MEPSTYKKILEYIMKNPKGISPYELSRVTGKSRVSVHTSLKRLVGNGHIEKHGSSPKVYYTLKNSSTGKPVDVYDLAHIKVIIEPILKRYPIIYAGVFGSVARGEATVHSDIDIMIDYHRPFSLITLIGLENELAEALGKKVDLVTEDGASKYMKEGMLQDLRVVYGSR